MPTPTLVLVSFACLFQADPGHPGRFVLADTITGHRPPPKGAPEGTRPTPVTTPLPVLLPNSPALLKHLIEKYDRVELLIDATGSLTAQDTAEFVRTLRSALKHAGLPGDRLKVRPVHQPAELPWVVMQSCLQNRTLPQHTTLMTTAPIDNALQVLPMGVTVAHGEIRPSVLAKLLPES